MRRSLLIFIGVLSLLVACERSEVFGGLTQSDANEILVLLTSHDVEAALTREVRQNETFFGVAVASKDIGRARQLLQENNLPRHKRPGLEEIFKDNATIIPSPQEVRGKAMLALKGEIINALESIPDVIEADVLLNVPAAEDFAADAPPQRTTASVTMKVHPTEQALTALTENKIQRFVANAVEKLDPRDVSVILTYAGAPTTGVLPGQTVILSGDANKKEVSAKAPRELIGDGTDAVSVAGLSVSPTSAGRLKLYLGLFLGLVAMLALGLVVMVIQASRMRQEMHNQTNFPALTGGTNADEEPQRQLGEEIEM